MGGMTTNIRALQLVGEVVWEKANEVFLAQDRIYCDSKKSIIGYAQGRQFRLNYVPSEVTKEGEYGNIVSYGAGTGLDAFNREIRISQREARGYVSKRWVRRNLEGIENVMDTENEIMDEVSIQALFH